MADFHKYKFLLSTKEYNDGWDRIFGKKEEEKKIKPVKKGAKKRRRQTWHTTKTHTS